MSAEQEFIELYRAFQHQVHNYIRRRVSAPEIAEELANDVFRIAWQKQGKGAEPSIAWLLSVARNVIGNEYRSGQRRKELVQRLSEHLQLNSQTNSNTAADKVATGIARLRQRDQEVLLLSYWEELSLAQIARVLGCSESAAGVRLFRARKELAKILSPQLTSGGED
ncbi:RNA polymerase sigma factor [Psychromicrobium lacuslunae]|uniref:RNA polymerase sigma factor n=1 Tax=Psychromicrobium lacuslunae TaxID=1618207 RepID=UPI0005D419E3|nr:RNA polymerase sigma factor [Psychromicrobium lacuslunae]